MEQNFIGLISKTGDQYCLYNIEYFTDEEKEIIRQMCERHVNEGYSVTGDENLRIKDIL